MPSERILELLKKLIAHEQSARQIGSLNEAEAFAERIQALCTEYRIGLGELGQDDVRARIVEVTWTWRDGGWRKTIEKNQRWFCLLANAVAEGHECRAARQGYRSDVFGFLFIGLETDANVAAAMFGVLLRAALQSWANLNDRRYKRSPFLFGFAKAIAFRYDERRNAGLRDNEAAQALVRTLDLELEQFMAGKGFKSKALTSPNFNKSMLRGFQAGQGVSLESKTLASGAKRLKA